MVKCLGLFAADQLPRQGLGELVIAEGFWVKEQLTPYYKKLASTPKIRDAYRRHG